MQQKRHGLRLPFMVLCVLGLIAGDLIIRRVLERGPYVSQPVLTRAPRQEPADAVGTPRSRTQHPAYGDQTGDISVATDWSAVNDPDFMLLDDHSAVSHPRRTGSPEADGPEVAYFPGYAYPGPDGAPSLARQTVRPQLLPAPQLHSLPLPVPVSYEQDSTGDVTGRVAIANLHDSQPSEQPGARGPGVAGVRSAVEATTPDSETPQTVAGGPPGHAPAHSPVDTPLLMPPATGVPTLRGPDRSPPAPQQEPKMDTSDTEPKQPAPIADDPDRQAVKSILIQEMPDASPEDRAIWLETFRGFPPETVRDLLRLRREHSDLLPHRLSTKALGSAPKPSASDFGRARIRGGHGDAEGQESLPPEPAELPDDQAPPLLQPGQMPDMAGNPWHNLPDGAALPEYSGEVPGQPGQYPGQPGQYPGQPGQPGQYPGQPGAPGMVPAMEHGTASTIESAREVILHNIANAQTAGYKRDRLVMINGTSGEPRLHVRQHIDFSAGKLQKTDRVLDLAISGEGLFAVSNGSQTFYTRCGQFELDRQGRIVLPAPAPQHFTDRPFACILQPELQIPAGASEIRVAVDGTVTVLDSETGSREDVGQIQLTRFTDPSTLVRVGNLFVVGETTPPGLVGDPGRRGFGLVCSGMLEASNVDLASEVALGQRLQSIAQAMRDVLSEQDGGMNSLYFDMSAQGLHLPMAPRH